jgi:hypothetical protein
MAHFVFESEKSNMHNQLLKQIQQGVKLKCVKTNDRSKPMLEGLRKFRRQLTIEEQIQKAEEAPVDDAIQDEMDDIDAVRDDLQSTKQMLAMELRNKEALERDNKRLQVDAIFGKVVRLISQLVLDSLHVDSVLIYSTRLVYFVYAFTFTRCFAERYRNDYAQARILNLETEVERMKLQKNAQESKQREETHDEKLTESLRQEAQQARKDAEKAETEYAIAAEERDRTKNELEEMRKMYVALERRMKAGT